MKEDVVNDDARTLKPIINVADVELQPRPEPDSRAFVVHDAKQPPRKCPRAERDGDLKREPGEKGR